MTAAAQRQSLDALRDTWRAAWPAALEVWSRFVQLHEPVWCCSPADEKREQLSGSFAMIRLLDHSIVISLRQVVEAGLQRFAREILAHEIGHHVYCPADLTDNARLLARIRRGLPTREVFAPSVSNLYSDLLINDRLQRMATLDIAGVYRQLGSESKSRLWTLYMRIYELLWSLPTASLASGKLDPRLQQDAQLGARLIRSYAKDWLGGGGRFAALCLPYIIDDDHERMQKLLSIWCDTRDAGRGGCPDGLIEIDEDESSGAIHPAEDPDLSGIDDLLEGAAAGAGTACAAGQTGRKSAKDYRQPFEYTEIMQAAGADLDEQALTARYYRERAIPYLVPFPSRARPRSVDPIPEGLDVWDVSSPIERIDWMGTLLASPHVIPGVTTRERLSGDSPGREPDVTPFDLYLGVDCSGSMGNPAHMLSYPVLAGAIIALSALRAGSRVKVVLSGEPGQSLSTEGFVRDQATVLRTLTSYLGTGYSFGIHRLAETFTAPFGGKPGERPVHILIVSDNDMFSMLDSKGNHRLGWDVAREAVQCCGGGGTYVLQIASDMFKHAWGRKTGSLLDRMQNDGWNVSLVNTQEELVAFAHDFSRRNYERRTRTA